MSATWEQWRTDLLEREREFEKKPEPVKWNGWDFFIAGFAICALVVFLGFALGGK